MTLGAIGVLTNVFWQSLHPGGSWDLGQWKLLTISSYLICNLMAQEFFFNLLLKAT